MNQLVFSDDIHELGCGSDTKVSKYNAILKNAGKSK